MAEASRRRILLALIAAGLLLDGRTPRGAALPLYIGAALAIGGLLATIGAAPNMLSLRRIGDDAPALTAAFPSGTERTQASSRIRR